MESLSFIQWCLDNLNYWTITLLMTIESSFIPFPSEIVVPPAAYKSCGWRIKYLVGHFICYHRGKYWCTNQLLFSIMGRKALVYKFANSRIGHMCLIDEASVAKAERYFDENGRISTFIGRLVPAVRQLISIPAGLARMKLSTFLLYTTLGAGLWNGILAAIGYYLESVVPQDQLMAKVSEYSQEIGWVFIAIGIFVLIFLVYKGMKKNKPTK